MYDRIPCNPSTLEADIGRVKTQSHFQLRSKLESNLGYMTLAMETRIRERKQKNQKHKNGKNKIMEKERVGRENKEVQVRSTKSFTKANTSNSYQLTLGHTAAQPVSNGQEYTSPSWHAIRGTVS